MGEWVPENDGLTPEVVSRYVGAIERRCDELIVGYIAYMKTHPKTEWIPPQKARRRTLVTPASPTTSQSINPFSFAALSGLGGSSRSLVPKASPAAMNPRLLFIDVDRIQEQVAKVWT